MTGRDKRKSFRVQETIYVNYEELSDEQFEAGIERWRIQNGSGTGARARMMDIDARLVEDLFLLRASNPKVGECIDLLREKIDIAIEQLPSFQDCKQSLAQSKPQSCDISADGMVFASEKPLQVGDRLVLRLLLETDSRYIESFCRVVRVTESQNGEQSTLPYGAAVEFVGMPAAQKEILIQHLFSREAETLRMKRLQMDM